MTTWNDFATDVMAAYPGRFDGEMVAHYIRALQGRGVTDPTVALKVLRQHVGEHPPSAPTIAAAVARHGQPDPPSFDELMGFVERTIASHTSYHRDDSADYVGHVAQHLGEAAARFVALVGVRALGAIPTAEALDRGDQIRRRDYERAYGEVVAGWRTDPRPVAVEQARQRDVLRGERFDVRALRPVPELERGDG